MPGQSLWAVQTSLTQMKGEKMEAHLLISRAPAVGVPFEQGSVGDPLGHRLWHHFLFLVPGLVDLTWVFRLEFSVPLSSCVPSSLWTAFLSFTGKG